MVPAISSLTLTRKEVVTVRTPKQPAVSFGERVARFYDNLRFPEQYLPQGMKVLYPYADADIREYARRFYAEFYTDNQERIFVFGINPGRLGSGATGVPFTDPVALEEYCNIANTLPKKRELTSRFIYEVVEKLGGARRFYQSFFLTAVCPVGFVQNGKNCNYYDNPEFLRLIKSFLEEAVQEQLNFGAKRHRVIVLGTGKNLDIFQALNEELGLFKTVEALPHPRFILQYQRKKLRRHFQEYLEVFRRK